MKFAAILVTAGLACAFGAGCADGDSDAPSAREVGRDIGEGAREVGQEAKEAGRELIEGAKDVAKGVEEGFQSGDGDGK